MIDASRLVELETELEAIGVRAEIDELKNRQAASESKSFPVITGVRTVNGERPDDQGDITVSLPAGSGEANTASNVGTGDGEVFKQKDGVDLEFKTIKAGTNVTITNNVSDVTIDASGAAGVNESLAIAYAIAL